MIENLNSDSACERCELGAFTIYGPTYSVAMPNIKARRLAIQRVETGKILIPEGSAPEKIYSIRSGWAFRYKEMPGGRRQILSFLIPGDLTLFESLIVSKFSPPYAVKSLTPVVLCTFAVGDMRQIMNATPEQSRELEVAVLGYIANLHRRIADLGRRNAHGRIAQLILELEGRLARRRLVKNHAFEFPLRQEHIADATGLTSAHVNRVLSELRKTQLIDLEPRRLRILDHAGLARVAEEG
ncbi:MAG: Crp/Fnr family transcriptional regulator [Rhizomicrobium sp.]